MMAGMGCSSFLVERRRTRRGAWRGGRRGFTAVVPQLKKALDENPQIWQDHGDLARQAEQLWITQRGLRPQPKGGL
jgi:hypothetical protein